MTLTSRLARRDDIPVLVPLMNAAIAELQRGFLDADQIRASQAFMGLDSRLIDDGTYFVVEAHNVEAHSVEAGNVQADNAEVGNVEAGNVEEDSVIAGCGGWSRRATPYGGDHSAGRDDALLDPAVDAARVRAMYTHPDFTRRGVGKLILARCEQAAAAEGFKALELTATLSGVPLYESVGFRAYEELTDAAGGVAVPLLRMRKEL